MWPSKASGRQIRNGRSDPDHRTDGGGYGDPARRAAELVLEDWRNGHVSVAEAREVYRVCIDEDRARSTNPRPRRCGGDGPAGDLTTLGAAAADDSSRRARLTARDYADALLARIASREPLSRPGLI